MRHVDSRFRRFIEFRRSRFSRLGCVSRYYPDATTIVERIVLDRFISLTCSPMWDIRRASFWTKWKVLVLTLAKPNASCVNPKPCPYSPLRKTSSIVDLRDSACVFLKTTAPHTTSEAAGYRCPCPSPVTSGFLTACVPHIAQPHFLPYPSASTG